LNWIDFWEALERNRAFPTAGATLFIAGATFRWFEPISRVLGRVGRRPDPFTITHAWIAERRAAGDETAARHAEERIRDQQDRMARYGRTMMVAGALIVALSLFSA
jgi:hypothetical protein